MKHHLVFVGAAFLAACQSPAPAPAPAPSEACYSCQLSASIGKEQLAITKQIELSLRAIAASPSMLPARDPSITPAQYTEASAKVERGQASAIPAPGQVDLPQALVTNILTNYERTIQVALDNIANINTIGYKKKVLRFEAIGGKTERSPGLRKDASGTPSPIGISYGNGSRVASVMTEFSQGPLEITRRNLDLAIQGQGMFQITNTNGELGYTRGGCFHVNCDSKLTTAQGFVLTPEISLATDVMEVNIDQDGRVTGRTAGSPNTTTQFGQIEFARFVNPSGLLHQGGGFYIQTDASGSPVLATPNSQGLGVTKQGFIERSNVELFHELIELRYARQNQQSFMQSLGIK